MNTHPTIAPSNAPTTAPSEALRPIAAVERVALLDVLRGFALYGVLLANTVPWYSGRALIPRAEARALLGPVDKVALFAMNLLVDSKAMTLLSFLFGLGFAVQLERAEEKGQSALPVYMRRLGLLFVIGLCHMAFLWWGDILVSYALTGFLLILLRRRGNRALLILAVALAFLPELIAHAAPVAAFIDQKLPNPGDRAAFKAQVLAAMRGNDYPALIRMQVLQAYYFVVAAGAWHFPWTLSRFLVGYVAGRSRRLHQAADHLPFFRKLFAWGLGLGLVCGTISAIHRAVLRQGTKLSPLVDLVLLVPAEIAVIATAAAYLSAITLLMQRPAWSRRLSVLMPVGQMALTTYLSQSLISTFVFYGWGLGLIGRVTPALCIPLTLTIFIAQILASRAWLRRFRFGPIEWVWRSLTYGRPQPMRRAEPA